MQHFGADRRPRSPEIGKRKTTHNGHLIGAAGFARKGGRVMRRGRIYIGGPPAVGARGRPCYARFCGEDDVWFTS